MASFPASLLESGEQPGIRTVALALLRDAGYELERLSESPDDEALHDFRVAVRRLRSWLRAHRAALGRSVPGSATRALRRVAQATNARRDSEVFAAWLSAASEGLTAHELVGARWVLREVTAEHEGGGLLPPGVDADFAAARETLEERLPLYQVTHHLADGQRDASFAAALAAAVRRQAASLRRRLDRVEGAADDQEIHRARIAGKRLRYLLEPVAPHLGAGAALVDRLKALQDTLGDLHDSHVWLAELRRRLERQAADHARHLTDTARLDATESEPPPDLPPGLRAVTDRLLERARTRFAEFASDWDEAPRAAFLADVERAAAALDHHGIGGMEIERKFLLYALPEHWPEGEVQFIEQGYIPGERLVERLRRVRSRDGEHWYRTVKSGTGLARLEVEEETTREVFDALWPLTVGRRVAKRRHRIPVGDQVWEVDEFTDRDLVLAEVELRRVDEEAAIPDWLAPSVVREVTGEPEYVNVNLAR